MTSTRACFVMEQTLGHVTHAQNLMAAARQQSAISARWVLVPFATSGWERVVPFYSGNWSLRASLRARRSLDAVVGEGMPDAVLFHTQVTALLSIGLMRRIPSIISLDATPLNFDTVGDAYGHRPAGTGWIDKRKHSMTQAAFREARALITWSEWARDSLVRDYGIPAGRISVLAPGAARRFFAIGAERFGGSFASEPVRVLFVGGDFERKGGRLLLDVIRAIRERWRIELHVVTSADVAPAAGVIVHRGVGPNSPELEEQFRRADIFVLPSFGECLSVALMEAAAAGLPVVTTDVGALREAVRDQENGFVIAPGDGSAMRAAIERLVSDRQLRIRFGAAGNALARANFDAERNGQRLFELIASIRTPQSQRTAA